MREIKIYNTGYSKAYNDGAPNTNPIATGNVTVTGLNAVARGGLGTGDLTSSTIFSSITIPRFATAVIGFNGAEYVLISLSSQYSAANLRDGTRTLTSTDSSTLRTLTVSDQYIRLGGSTAGSFVFHAASNTGRFVDVKIRNTGSATWTVTSADAGDLFYQSSTGVSSFSLSPGQSLPFFNPATNVWEVPS